MSPKCLAAAVLLALMVLVVHDRVLADPGDFILGLNVGDDDTYTLEAGQRLEVTHNAYLGYEGKGTVNHLGGEAWVANDMYLGYEGTGQGFYNLQGGVLSVSELRLALSAGYGEFTQHGGEVVMRNRGGFSLGGGGTGLYTMVGGNLFSGRFDLPAGLGSTLRVEDGGRFVQVHGNVGLAEAAVIGPGGTYDISGGALTSRGNLHVGGMLRLSGGNVSAQDDVFIGIIRDCAGFPIPEEPGIVAITGGALSALDKMLRVSESSYITDQGTAPGYLGGTVIIGEDFANESTLPWLYSTVRTTLRLACRPDVDPWSVYFGDVQNVGAAPEGLDENFAVGALIFGAGTGGQPAEYRLESDVYVYGLTILSDANVDLNGHTIYYLEDGSWHKGLPGGGFTNSGEYTGGQVLGMTPEPATLSLLALGGAVALRRRPRRRARQSV